jgi:hypothetical protein
MFVNEKVAKSCFKFYCEKCGYGTVKKSSMDKHVVSSKHLKSIIVNEIVAKSCCVSHTCQNCKKTYKEPSGLWRHKQKCVNVTYNTNNTNVEDEKITDDNLIVMLINQCKELRDENKELIDIIKNGTHNTNSHNKTFNLQFFLNETCKDAMNLMDFVDSIKLQLTDLEKVGRIGFVEGISNIITTNLKALDITQRPIHCTDNKREILYVKDENKWEKEADEKNKIRKAIKMVAHKNIKILPKFKESHPDCSKSESKYSDQYNKIVVESFGGSGDNDSEKEDKIIKNIAKGVGIEK